MGLSHTAIDSARRSDSNGISFSGIWTTKILVLTKVIPTVFTFSLVLKT